MRRTALLIDRRYADHATLPGDPERPERVLALLPIADAPGRGAIVRVEPRAATRDEIVAVHTPAHFERVAASAGKECTVFDPDTAGSADSYEVALLAAGGVLAVIDAIEDGRADNALALVRPPGHHAESNRIMGFCLFNHVAVGAEHLRRRHGREKVLIVDWDVHHGNGTQEIFWNEPDVLYVSLHQHPLFPGTGAAEETGGPDAPGATLNVPLPPGCGDEEFLASWDRIVAPAARRFDPDFVLVSAGFDAHERDPLGSMRMTDAGFARLARRVLTLADEHCDGRVACVLEGGYDLDALASATRAVLLELGEDE